MAKTRPAPKAAPAAAPKSKSTNLDALASIVELFKSSGLSSLSYEDKDLQVHLEAHGAAPVVHHAAPVIHHAPAAPVHAPAAAPAPVAAPLAVPALPAAAAGGHLVTSPFVGTFYASPNPTAGPFVSVGTVVKKGQTLCIVEAMKLMNEIEADEAGTVAEIFAENAHPVEFGQKLFRIIPA